MAQFRELEAFTQFGSDLDKDTQKRLDRGRRAIELLKQNQYSPMAVEKQTMVLYALSNGYMDDVPVEKIREFESDLVDFIERKIPEFYKQIQETGNFNEKIEEILKKTIDEFKKTFNA